MNICGRHPHSSTASARKCYMDWVDKHKIQPALYEPSFYKLQIYRPPVKIKRGPIDVLLFSEGLKTRGYRHI